MISVDNVKYIMKLCRSANQERFSTLSEEQQQAVMLIGDFFPAELENGKAVYAKNGKFHTLAASYMAFRSPLEMLPEKLKGFSKNSFHVFMDSKLPDFIETTWQDAINSFPSWKIPVKKCDAIHLPALTQPNQDLGPDPIKVAAALAELQVRIIRDMDIPENMDAIHKLCHLYKDNARNLGDSLGQKAAVITILNVIPERYMDKQIEVEGQLIDKKKFKLPRGTLSPEGLAGSYLANYITQAVKGIYLKAEADV